MGDVFIHVPDKIWIKIVHMVFPYADDKLGRHVPGLFSMGSQSENKPFFAQFLQFATGLLPINFCPTSNYTGFFGNQREKERQFCFLGSEKSFQNTQFHATFSGWESAREIIQMTGHFFVNICCCHTIMFLFC